MRISIDSNQFIFGITGVDAASEQLLLHLPVLDVVIPRLVLKEVTRNLRPSEVSTLYSLLIRAPGFLIVEEPVPQQLLQKYINLGLREKGDAFIGAFAEWQQVDFLISENRHFLAELKTSAFEVLTPVAFFRRLTGEA